MLISKDPKTMEIQIAYDTVDWELVQKAEATDWRAVIEELLGGPPTNLQEDSYKLTTALAHYGMEQYGELRSGTRSGGSILGGWNMGGF